jgi:hypothetical protein
MTSFPICSAVVEGETDGEDGDVVIRGGIFEEGALGERGREV